MSIIKIFIPVSQLATLIGLSKYGSFTQLLMGFWMKADFNGYSQRTIELEQKHGKSFKFINEMEKLEMLSNELGLDNKNIKAKTLSAMKNTNHTGLLNNQNNILDEISNVKNPNVLDLEEKKKALGKLVSSFSNRGYGNNNEESVIDLYSRMTGMVISQQQKTLFYKIKNPKKNSVVEVEWYLKGKIDGLAKSSESEGEEILVEIKNRTRALFGVLKDYEKPQIQCYLKMMNLQHSHLVEHLANSNSNSNSKEQVSTNIIDVYFEEEYWKMIKNKMNVFLKFFDFFLDNQQLQDALLMNQYNEDVEKHFVKIRDSMMT